MDVNFDEAEGGMRFEEKKRYPLIVNSAEEIYGKQNGTPGLKLKLITDNEKMDDAYEAMIWLSPKALFRAQEWFKALGLKTEGKVSVDPSKLSGIRITAECYYDKYTVEDKTAATGVRECRAVRWHKPERVVIGGSSAPAPAAAPEERTAPAAASQSESVDEVPF